MLDVTANLGFGTSNTANLIVRFDFPGAVLTELSMPTLSGGTGFADEFADAQLRQGGMAKDDFVVFLLPAATGRTATSEMTLSLGEIAVSAGGTSIIMIAADDLSIPASSTARMNNAITLKSALMPTKMPMNHTALVSEKFLKFKDPDVIDGAVTTVNLGSVVLDRRYSRHAERTNRCRRD